MRSQRLRVTFAKGPTLRFITHLDLMRFWERALRRASVALAYSEGFSPHPQISLAAPLPVGVTGRAELMDIFLAERSSPRDVRSLLSPQLPPGLSLSRIVELPVGLPSIQSQMRAAEYRVELPADTDLHGLARRIDALLRRDSLPWQHAREKEIRNYDLRPLIQALALCSNATGEAVGPALCLRLQADNTATGRPDQVLAALELPTGLQIERTRLLLAPSRPVNDAETVARHEEQPAVSSEEAGEKERGRR